MRRRGSQFDVLGDEFPSDGSGDPRQDLPALRRIGLRRRAMRAVLRVGNGHGSRAMLALVVALGSFGVASASAIAAAPETPQTEAPTEVRSTAVVLRGVLNPAHEGEAGSYEFLYKQSSTECEGGSAAPEPAGLALGAEHEEVSQEIEGLEPGTEYSVCVVARNGSEEAVGPRVTFKTTRPPEVPTAEKAIDVTGTTATLQGELNPGAAGEPGGYQFVYTSSGESCQEGEAQGAPVPAGPAEGHEHEVVEVGVTGLLPHTTYAFCLTANNEAFEFSEGASVTFSTPATAPSVGAATAISVGGTFAQVGAEVSANGLPTQYWAEYVSDASFGATEWASAVRVPVGGAALAASSTPVPVVEGLSGLQPATGYHVRFVASNSAGSVPGAAVEIATSSGAETTSSTPDGRVYELVSTTGNTGEPYVPPTPTTGARSTFSSRQLFQSAANGDSIAYIGDPSSTEGTGNIGAGEGNQWLAKRAPAGWVANIITPSGSELGTVYQAFSEDLTTGILQTDVQPVLAEGAPEAEGCQALYARDDETATYKTLFTASDVTSECGHPLYAGASEGDAHIIFQSEAPLTPSAEAATEVPEGHPNGHNGGEGSQSGEPCTYGCNLYETSADGGLTLVNVLPGPEHQTVPNATFGGYAGENAFKTNFSNAISTDGTRVFWTDTQAGPNMEHVYVLEDGTEVQVSGANPAEYWTATADGRYAYYTEGGRLWRFDTVSNTREPLTGEESEVEGVIGINNAGEDQNYLYFVAGAALAGNANAHNETAQPEQPNLYVIHAGATRFIATLSPTDDNLKAIPSGSEQYGDWVANVGDRTAEVTPDGSHAVFQSLKQLTGYNNEDSANESTEPEVFVYDGATEELACASCEPTGVQPNVPESEEHPETKLLISNESDTQMRRWMSDDGSRVFFESRQRLASQDKNGSVLDVYEWEAEGEGSCTTQSTPRLNHGCVFLLSGGNSEDNSYFVDADASGGNVFFTHRGPLGQVASLTDKTELYDARVDGGFSEPVPTCSGSGCVSESPPTAPPPPSASMSFSGGGNFPATAPAPPSKGKTTPSTGPAAKRAAALKACKKKYGKSKKRRAQCEKRARKRYPAKKAAKKARRAATTGQGAKR